MVRGRGGQRQPFGRDQSRGTLRSGIGGAEGSARGRGALSQGPVGRGALLGDELEKSPQRVQELERQLAAMEAAASAKPPSARGARVSPSDSILEVGADAGSQSVITILDPNVPLTRGFSEINLREVIVVSDSCYAGAMTAAENGAIATISPGDSEELALLARPCSKEAAGINRCSRERRSIPLTRTADRWKVIVCLRRWKRGSLRVAQQFNFDQAPVYAAIQHAGHEGGDFVFVPIH